MRAAKRNRCRDRGMSEQNFIHFMGCNIFAAADDDVLDPPGQVQIAVFVEQALVAGAKPSIHQSAGIGFGIIFIPSEHARSLNDNLPALVGWEMVALLV